MRTVSIVVLLGLAMGAVSCGDEPPRGADGRAGSASSTQPSTQPSTTEDPLSDPTPTSPGKPARHTTTVTGVVAAGVEAGCLLLETGSETLLLVGARPEDALPGSRIRVTGSKNPGLMTTCQQGIPFQVEQIRPVD